MTIGLLSLGVFISGMLAIWTGYRQSPRGFYTFKPLTMILIILIPTLGGEGFSLLLGLITAGLIFSVLGDVFLMLPDDRFLSGLVAFLIAHLFYILGFLIDQGRPIYWPILPVFGLAGLAVWFLKGGFGKLKYPAFAYVGVISCMVWLAWSRWINGGQTHHLLAFCGAGLFMMSDLILSVNRFKVRFKAARALELATYYTGQWLIALSVIELDKLGF